MRRSRRHKKFGDMLYYVSKENFSVMPTPLLSVGCFPNSSLDVLVRGHQLFSMPCASAPMSECTKIGMVVALLSVGW